MSLARILGWLTVIVGVAFLLLARPTLDDGAIARDRLITYRVEDGLTFALSPDEEQVKFISWLVPPTHQAPDTRRSWPYRVEAIVRDVAGKEVESQQFWIRGRMGWIERLDTHAFEAPSRFEADDSLTIWPNRSTRPPEDICDDRLTLLDVHGLVPHGGTIEIHPLDVPEGGRLVGIAFERSRRSDVDQAREASRKGSTVLARAAARLGPFDFLEYSEDWRMNLAEFEWRRLSALNDGIDRNEPRRVEAAFERLPFEDVAAVAWPLWPGGVASFNLEGKASIAFQWWKTDASGVVNSAALMRIVHNNRAPDAPTTIDKTSSFGPFEVDGGVNTVEVALPPDAPGPLLLRATTTGAEVDRAFGDPPRRAYPDGVQAVAPDLRSVVPWRTGPGLSPLYYNLNPGELVQVTARQRLAPGLLAAFDVPALETGVSVVVEALDPADKVIRSWTRILTPMASAWERYTEQDDPSTARVSEPERVWFEPAPGMAGLRISATGLVDVDMEVKLPLPEIVAREYDLPSDTDPHVSVDWEPHRDTPWQARNPRGAEGLFEEHRQVRIDGQVRLDWRPDEPVVPAPITVPPGGVPGIVHVPAVVVVPPARHYEPLPVPAPFELVARPAGNGGGEGGAVSHLGRDASTVVIGDDGALEVEYRVAAALVGKTATFKVGGQPWNPLLESTSGTLRLEGLNPGSVHVGVSTVGTFLARAVGSDAWSIRKLRPLKPGATLHITLPEGAGQVLVDTYSTAGVALTWDLQDERQEGLLEHPPERGGVARLAARRPASALSFESPTLQQLDPLVIERGVARGELSISYTALPGSAGQPLYIRILAEKGGTAPTDPTRHWRTGVR